ncbi:MAG: RpiB/LacA/LacB family sugar-phosphate isomerase [Candidatus Latescibacteria bacterium]|nr:RpiB/LacA/LacB family sugar-phosphate isomerase [Candidatus Latescibacterota bacterium]
MRAFLAAAGHAVTDFGTYSAEPVDFPDIAQLVCGAVRGGQAERGVLVCGTGVGACIAGNKVPGIRAAVCHDIYSAHQCVEHDDVNLLCLGAQIVGIKLAEEIIASHLRAQFSTEDHFRRRVAKLGEMERAAARELGGDSVG